MTFTRRAATVLAGVGLALLPAGAAVAVDDPATPTPSPGAVTVTRAGTSFLTATGINIGQPVRMSASTGDYLYWSFSATAGQTHQVAITVTLPESANRHGASTWTVDVFDGLRRRQACTSGAQTPTAATTDSAVRLGCTLRQVRSWAEPWSGDPLPGLYYVRLSVVDLPESDLGLPVQVDMILGLLDTDDPSPEGGELKAPLVPAASPGAALAATDGAGSSPAAADGSGSTDPDAEAGEESWFARLFSGWFPDLSSRWIWTTVGGILAAIGGVFGFTLTRRPRRSPVG